MLRLSVPVRKRLELRRGRDTGMASALTLAKTVHDDLTLGSVTRWQYWIAVSKSDFCDSLVYVDEFSQRVTKTKRLWALGNYSRFIAPGSARVAVSTPAGLKTSAFLSPDREQLTVVVINSSDNEKVCSTEVGETFRTFERFETSATRSLASVQRGHVEEPAQRPPRACRRSFFRRGVLHDVRRARRRNLASRLKFVFEGK